MLADLALIDLHAIAFTPLNDLREQLVHCEDGRDVVLTMVAGRVVAEHGHVTSVDEAALLDEARELFAAKLPGASGAAQASADRLFPAYQHIVRRAARHRRRLQPLAHRARGAVMTNPADYRYTPLPAPPDRQLARRQEARRRTCASASSPTASATATPRTCCPACPHPTW